MEEPLTSIRWSAKNPGDDVPSVPQGFEALTKNWEINFQLQIIWSAKISAQTKHNLPYISLSLEVLQGYVVLCGEHPSIKTPQIRPFQNRIPPGLAELKYQNETFI